MSNYELEVEREKNGAITVKKRKSELMRSRSVTDLLLFMMLERLEEIRCGLIDLETALEEKNK